MADRKLLMVLAAASLSLTACSQPCSRLVEHVCGARGAGASQCSEMKSFSERSGRTEQEYCRTALSVIESMSKSAKAADRPGAGRESAK